MNIILDDGAKIPAKEEWWGVWNPEGQFRNCRDPITAIEAIIPSGMICVGKHIINLENKKHVPKWKAIVRILTNRA